MMIGRSALASMATALLEIGRVRPHAAGLSLQRAGVDPEIAGVEIILAVGDVLGHVDA